MVFDQPKFVRNQTWLSFYYLIRFEYSSFEATRDDIIGLSNAATGLAATLAAVTAVLVLSMLMSHLFIPHSAHNTDSEGTSRTKIFNINKTVALAVTQVSSTKASTNRFKQSLKEEPIESRNLVGSEDAL
jgi:hypothetical protein